MLKMLGPFQVLEVVGKGGMGTVYRGLDPIIGRPVAIKVIRLLGYNDAEERVWLRDRLFREARAAGCLSHPAIVTIYQVGEDMDVAYIAMEFVEGCTMQDVMDGEAGADKTNLCRILWESANALDYAHHKGLVHRDIKPANIMVSVSGATKVTDFGIAKSALSQSSTVTGQIFGTVFYMSPEQVRGEALDGRSDQFALAVIAYEVFTGRKPFQAEHTTSICYQIIHQEPLSPEDINPAIGKKIAAVIKRGLSKTPAARYGTCAEFASALRVALAETTLAAAPQRVVQPPTREVPIPTPFDLERHAAKRLKHYNLLLAALAGLFVLLLPVIAVAVYRTFQKAPVTAALPAAMPPVVVNPVEETPPISPPVIKPFVVELALPPPVVPVREPQPERRPSAAFAAPAVASPEPPASATGTKSRGLVPLERLVPTEKSSPRGILVWTGRVAKGTQITISGSSASSGSLAGALPGNPFRIQVYPAEESKTGLTVFTADPAYATAAVVETPRGRASFTFDPRHSTDIVVFEHPGPTNNWKRLVFQINNPNISACVIQWQDIGR